MSNLTDFFPSEGGGGLTPKFQEFNSSGTFTPSQALIDAGGYIELFLVGGGGGGSTVTNSSSYQPTGGRVLKKRMYLTNTNPVSVSVGSGGGLGNPSGGNGGTTTFNGSSAGGVNISALGGGGGNQRRAQAGNALRDGDENGFGMFHSFEQYGPTNAGIDGYGIGGPRDHAKFPIGGTPNSGQAGVSSSSSNYYRAGSSGYCLIKWYE